MINLKSIEIEGFGSVIKPIKYKIGVVGLNKIEGPNGAGKTTITNALAWVGWGQLVKPKKSSFIPWPHIIDANYHGTKVSLKFNDGQNKYQIIRCNEYHPILYGKPGKNRLIIIENGKVLEGHELRDKKDYQQWIIKKIGYSFELFKSTVLFTQELDSLMKEDGPAKKRIFDEAFETTFVNRAKEKVEERLKNVEGELILVNTKLQVQKAKLNGLRETIKATKESLQNFEDVKKRRISDALDKAMALRTRMNELNGELIRTIPVHEEIQLYKKKIADLDDLVKDEFKLDMRKNAVLGQVEDGENYLKEMKEHYFKVPKKCDACGQKIPPEKIIAYREEIQKKISLRTMTLGKDKKALAEFEKQHAKVKRKITKLERFRKKISDLRRGIDDLEIIQNNLNSVSQNLKEKEEEILALKAEKPLNNKLPGLIASRNILKREIAAKLNHKKDVVKELKIDKWLIKDPLSNSGLKAFIFDSMLGRVNNYLKQYTSIIGFGIKVFIDMSSAHKDIRIAIEKGGDEVPYEDLSKGQKQLANVVLAFSLSDAVQAIKPINAIFLDELFESLNTENIEKVGNIIIRKAQNKCIHLITHHTAFNPPNCNVTQVELDSHGHTYLI